MSPGFWAMTMSTVPSLSISMAVSVASKATTLTLPLRPLFCHDLTGALGAEDVGAEDAAQIGFFLQHGFHLRLRLGGIVVVVVHAHQGHIRVLGQMTSLQPSSRASVELMPGLTFWM